VSIDKVLDDIKRRGKTTTYSLEGLDDLHVDQTGLDFIASNEGFYSKVYNDASPRTPVKNLGTPKGYRFKYGPKATATIGYGHLPHPNLKDFWEDYLPSGNKKLTKDEAMQIKKAQLMADYEHRVKRRLKRLPTQNQFNAFVDRVYLGAPGKQWGKIIAAFNAGDDDKVYDLLYNYTETHAKPTNKFFKGWSNRDKRRAKLFGSESESGEDENLEDDGRVRIAFIGDSNANVMARKYKEDEDNQDKNLRNFSAGGWGVDLSTRSWLKTLELYKKALDSGDEKVKGFSSEARKANRLLKFRPDVITVLNLGGNDVGTFRKNPDAYKEKAKRLMELVDEFGGSYIGAAAVPASIKTRTALNAALAEVAEEVGVKFYNPTENTPYGTRRGVWSGIGDMVHLGSVEARKEYEKRKEAGLSDFAASEKRAKPAARSQKLPKDLLETGTPSDVLKAAAKIMVEAPVRESVFKKWIKSTKGDPRHTYIAAYKGDINPDTVIKDFKNIYKLIETGQWSGDDISPETTPVAYDFIKVQLEGQDVANKQNPPLEEINKGNNQMKIAQERLAQIIKEEVEAYKVSQLNEIDVDELEEEEAYIKEIADLLKGTYDTFFQSAAPAVGTPQTKADTGERVTDQTAHEDAKGILLDLLGNAIDEFQEKGSMHEDGHDDVPSAVRAMKTMAEDALEMLDALEQMDGSLPTWWTNKMAVSASMLNKMRDYLLVPSLEERDQYAPCPQTDSATKTRCEQERQKNRQKKDTNESIDEQ
jgi:GH24 family phage-related lysozyme (muramidase)